MKTMKHTVALMVLVGASSAFALDADFNTIDSDGTGAT
ncbi:calmodulin, partial [Pseudoalteromonas ruthenica]